MGELDGGGDAEPRRSAGRRRGGCTARARSAAAARATSARVAANASSASRFARSPIAWTASGRPCAAARRISRASSSADVISTPVPSSSRAVREPERPVHERLDVVAALERLGVGGHRLPHAEREPGRGEQLGRALPAVLVVDGDDARRGHGRQRGAHRVERLRALGREAGLEAPGRLLAQDPGRLAAGVALDHAAGRLEVAARERERRRVEPQRVAVVRAQRDRRVRHDRVERARGRAARRPATARRASRGRGSSRPRAPWRAHACDGLAERARVEQRELATRERPRGEVHVRVGEARQRAAAREVEALRAARRVGGVVEHGGDAVAVEQERRGGGPRRVHRADRPAVQEQHRRQRYRRSPPIPAAPRRRGSPPDADRPRHEGTTLRMLGRPTPGGAHDAEASTDDRR